MAVSIAALPPDGLEDCLVKQKDGSSTSGDLAWQTGVEYLYIRFTMEVLCGRTGRASGF